MAKNLVEAMGWVIGTHVENFDTHAVVIGGDRERGILLRQFSPARGKMIGGKWYADPSKVFEIPRCNCGGSCICRMGRG